ncbi:MAG: hypothetical protein NVS3B28_04920 [Candidatus Velthaea sp.]
MTATRSTLIGTTFAIASIAFMTFFFGMNPIASKVLFRPDGAHFDGIGLFTARAAWALPLFAVLALATLPRAGIAPRDWWKFLILGVCWGPAQTGVYALSAEHTSAAHISLLLALAPIVTGVLSYFILGEALTTLRIGALTLGIIGAVVLTFTKSSTGSHWSGDAIMLGFVVSYPFFTILLRVINAKQRYNPLFVTGMFGLIGTTLLLIAGIALGRGAAVFQPLNGAPDNLVWFFGVIIIGLTILTQILQTYALRTIPAGTFSVIASYGSLIFGLGGAYIVLGERLTPTGVLAGALLAVALGLAVMPAKRAAASLERVAQRS